MKPFILLPRFFVILSSLLVAQASSAHLQYTYTSDVLEWQSTFLNDMDFGEEINNDEDRKIEFNFSFDIDESLLSAVAPTSFILKNADIYADRSLGDPFFEPDFQSLVYGRVTINPDKTIRYWNLIMDLAISNPFESAYVNRLSDHDMRIISGGGLNTCNCDRLWENINLVIPRPQNTWIIAATVDNYYRTENDVDNWSVKSVDVTEPNSLMLAAVGLMGFWVMRRKKIALAYNRAIHQ